MVFLAILLAHLLGDFPLQPIWIAEGKVKSIWFLLLHGLIHYTLLWICIAFFAQAEFLSFRTQFLAFAYLVVHLLIDYAKSKLVTKNVVRENLSLFLADQFAHIAVIILVAALMTKSSIIAMLRNLHASATAKLHILLTAIIYVSVVFGGGYLIRQITRGISKEIAAENPIQLGNAGLYIGWIERFLIVTAMLMQSPALVGLILTGKSIARYPEFKEARFVEYFLIGTLLSISLAVLGGILLLQVLYGTVSLK